MCRSGNELVNYYKYYLMFYCVSMDHSEFVLGLIVFLIAQNAPSGWINTGSLVVKLAQGLFLAPVISH